MHHLVTALPRPGDIQKPLSSTNAALIGLVVFGVVTLEELWRVLQHVYTIAHEGGHALVGSSLGHRVVSVTVKKNADGSSEGLTVTRGGGGAALIAFAGYVVPSAFGLIAAKLISLGHSVAVLWIAVVLLVLLLPVLSATLSFVSVILTAALLVFVARYTTTGVETVVAYGLTWFLLLSGVRMVLAHGPGAGDAANLRKMTRLPQTLWSLLWLAGTVYALALGGSLLV